MRQSLSTPGPRVVAAVVALAVLLAVALFLVASRGGSGWNEPPEGYAAGEEQTVMFRVFGPDSVTAPLGVNQNRCRSSAAGLKFRTLDGSAVRVYAMGWGQLSNLMSASGSHDLPVSGPIADAGLPADAEPLVESSSGELSLGSACDSVYFSGETLTDVVMTFVYFSPVP